VQVPYTPDRPAAPRPTISLDDVDILEAIPVPGAEPAAMTARTPAPVASPAVDPFTVVRRAGVNPVAAWFRDGPPEAALPQPPAAATHLNEDEAVAAACFDRGLSLVSERRPLEAVLYWERAVALAPGELMYQEQLRRLINQIRDEHELGPRTPNPNRTSIRKD
jgi:hypothetical protein